MNSTNKAKYYAASRTITQNVNVELTKLYTGSSDAKNYKAAVKTVMNNYNKNVTGDTYAYAIIFTYINGKGTDVYITPSSTDDNYQKPDDSMSPEKIKYMTIYYKKSLTDGSITCYCDVYPNKKILYHSM